jgi:ACS family tartrate transporter-like MFS transporter
MGKQDQVFAKCAWRLIPFMMLLYVTNYLDRVNVGFAALTMNKDLGFSPSIYGFAAGIFFLSYAMFQVPANVILERVGARRSVFCIMGTWGALSAATAFVQEPVSFYILRFLLGVAEAGFFPGMILYLTFWFPHLYRARFTAIFMAAIPLSSIFGGPISGLILGMDGVAGLHGWQWLFLLEGLPAFFLAFAVLKLLPDSPASAAWLTGEEKATIAERIAAEQPMAQSNVWTGLSDPRVLALGLAGMCAGIASWGSQLWLPQIVQAMGFSNFSTGLVVALFYLAGMAAMILWGSSSDRRGERVWHMVISWLVMATGLLVVSFAQSDIIVLMALALAIVGLMASFGPFYTLSASFLSGPAAAGSIALVNVFATGLGGLLGPLLVGKLKEQTGDYSAAMVAMAAALMVGAVIVLVLGRAMAARRFVVKPTI